VPGLTPKFIEGVFVVWDFAAGVRRGVQDAGRRRPCGMEAAEVYAAARAFPKALGNPPPSGGGAEGGGSTADWGPF